jgi:DNA-directed RNA polymerase subunit K/omega
MSDDFGEDYGDIGEFIEDNLAEEAELEEAEIARQREQEEGLEDSDEEHYVVEEKRERGVYRAAIERARPVLTKYQMTAILSFRVKMLDKGAPPLVKTFYSNHFLLAEEEFRQGRLNFIEIDGKLLSEYVIPLDLVPRESVRVAGVMSVSSEGVKRKM